MAKPTPCKILAAIICNPFCANPANIEAKIKRINPIRNAERFP